MKGMAALAGITVVVASLAACAAPAPHPTSTAPLPPIGTVVAAARIDDAADRLAGTAELVRTADDYRLRVTALADAASAAVLALSSQPAGSVCSGRLLDLDYGVDLSHPTSFDIHLPGVVAGGLDGVAAHRWLLDPTLLRTIVLERQQPSVADPCDVETTASLRWRIRPFGAGLVVRDHGAQTGAQGQVRLTNGVPTSYALGNDDGLLGVESRFGLTHIELLYLNPYTLYDDPTADLEVGTVLNLDPEHRGEVAATS